MREKQAGMRGEILTIGYERATPAGLVAALRAAGVGTLVDIRAVARSRRPGFSKGALSAAAGEAGIGYAERLGLSVTHLSPRSG